MIDRLAGIDNQKGAHPAPFLLCRDALGSIPLSHEIRKNVVLLSRQVSASRCGMPDGSAFFDNKKPGALSRAGPLSGWIPISRWR
jgi:hypothetical protein